MSTREDGQWYCKIDGQTMGPISTRSVKELIAMRRIDAGHAVWKRRRNDLVFFTAQAATTGADEDTGLPLPDAAEWIARTAQS
jgi:hypothetical protein